MSNLDDPRTGERDETERLAVALAAELRRTNSEMQALLRRKEQLMKDVDALAKERKSEHPTAAERVSEQAKGPPEPLAWNAHATLLLEGYATPSERDRELKLRDLWRKQISEAQRIASDEELLVLFRTLDMRDDVATARAAHATKQARTIEARHERWCTLMTSIRTAMNAAGWETFRLSVEDDLRRVSIFYKAANNWRVRRGMAKFQAELRKALGRRVEQSLRFSFDRTWQQGGLLEPHVIHLDEPLSGKHFHRRGHHRLVVQQPSRRDVDDPRRDRVGRPDGRFAKDAATELDNFVVD